MTEKDTNGKFYLDWYYSTNGVDFNGPNTPSIPTARQFYRQMKYSPRPPENFLYNGTQFEVRNFQDFDRLVKAWQEYHCYVTGRVPESSGVIYKNAKARNK